MSNFRKRAHARWAQVRIETAILIAGLRGVIVNLAYIGRLRATDTPRIAVLVDSQREAVVLKLLRLSTAVPWCTVHVIQRPLELDAFAQTVTADGALLVVTSRLYLKHYQQMADLRRRQRLLVL